MKIAAFLVLCALCFYDEVAGKPNVPPPPPPPPPQLAAAASGAQAQPLPNQRLQPLPGLPAPSGSLGVPPPPPPKLAPAAAVSGGQAPPSSNPKLSPLPPLPPPPPPVCECQYNPCQQVNGSSRIGCPLTNKYIQCENTVCGVANCPSGQVWNVTQNQCTACPSDMQLSPDNQKCVCGPNLAHNPKTKTCLACPTDATIDNDKCTCTDGTKYFNPETWSCLTCPTGITTLQRRCCVCSAACELFNFTTQTCFLPPDVQVINESCVFSLNIVGELQAARKPLSPKGDGIPVAASIASQSQPAKLPISAQSSPGQRAPPPPPPPPPPPSPPSKAPTSG